MKKNNHKILCFAIGASILTIGVLAILTGRLIDSVATDVDWSDANWEFDGDDQELI